MSRLPLISPGMGDVTVHSFPCFARELRIRLFSLLLLLGGAGSENALPELANPHRIFIQESDFRIFVRESDFRIFV